MFQVGDTVLYGAEGVCTIEEIAIREFAGQEREYYVLKPVHQQGSFFYLPTQSPGLQAKLRKVLTIDEIYELIHTVPNKELIWIENESERKVHYRKIIQSGDRLQLITLIKTLYLHREALKEEGKKFHVCDERLMKEAEKLLYDEFAYALQIRPDQVLPFIMEQLKPEEKRD